MILALPCFYVLFLTFLCFFLVLLLACSTQTTLSAILTDSLLNNVIETNSCNQSDLACFIDINGNEMNKDSGVNVTIFDEMLSPIDASYIIDLEQGKKSESCKILMVVGFFNCPDCFFFLSSLKI